jgi:predicted short-subunit dehydrogenase-like oxidoreductase (DUF2520 family)
MAVFLIRTFRDNQIPLLGIWGRNTDQSGKLASQYGIRHIQDMGAIPPETGFCFLAVSDDAIPEVSLAVPSVSGPLVHTSGAAPLDAIASPHRKAVLYPLQTLGGGPLLSASNIPFLLEASHPADLRVLHRLADRIAQTVVEMSSQERLKLHLAAVMVNNFTNHIIELAEDYCKEAQLPFSLLHPLIERTAQLAIDFPGQSRQTGPAKRADQQTIRQHLALLHEHSALRELYETLTQSLQKRYPPEK